MTEVTLVGTTVTELGDVSVGCGNFYERDWIDPDGTVRDGLAATVSPFDGGSFDVGHGTRFVVDGIDWVVAAIKQVDDEPGQVIVRQRGQTNEHHESLRVVSVGAETIMVQGIDWSTADIEALVATVMGRNWVGSNDPEDRYPIQVLGRAYRELGSHPELQDRLANQIATWTLLRRRAVLRFFSHCPMASGGDALARLIVQDNSAATSETPLDQPGLIGQTFGEATLYGAVRWCQGQAVTAELVNIVHREILVGRAPVLISPIAKYDEAWMRQHGDQLLVQYPDESGSIWNALVDLGGDPIAVAETALVTASAQGRKSLRSYLLFADEIDDATTARIATMLDVADQS